MNLKKSPNHVYQREEERERELTAGRNEQWLQAAASANRGWKERAVAAGGRISKSAPLSSGSSSSSP
jgi:hypothetical protein